MSKLADDIIKATVQIGTNEAQKSLTDLARSTGELKSQNEALRITQTKLKALGMETSAEYKAVTKQIAENTSAIKANDVQMNTLRQTLGVTEMSMKQLRAQATNLKREINSMVEKDNPAKYKALNDQLKATETQMKQVGSQIGLTKVSVSSLADEAKSLLPAFGLAAIVAGIGSAAKAIINSTHATANAFEFSVNGMKTGLSFFWQTLATGDWSNFTTRMRKAINGGYEFAKMMDEVDDRTRAFSMMDADSRQKAVDLEIALRNKMLSPEERKKAGLERIALEETLVVKRIDIAQMAFYAEQKDALRQTQMTKEELDAVARDIDSRKKLDAQAYDEKVDAYNKLRALNTTTTAVGYSTTVIQKEDTPEMKLMKKEIDFTDASVKEYAGLMKQFDIMKKNSADKGEVTQDSFTAAYNNLKQAAVSGKENIKKVYSQVSTQEKAIRDDQEKATADAIKSQKEASDKAIELLSQQQNKEMAILVDKYTNEGMSDGVFKAEQEKLDVEYLLKKQASLQEHGQSTIEVDKQINDKRIQSQKEFNDAMAKVEEEYQKDQKDKPVTADEAGVNPASMVTPEDLDFASKKHSIDEWTAYLIKKTNEQIKIKEKYAKIEKDIQDARDQLVDAQIGGIEQVAGAMAGMFEEGSAAQIAFFALEKAMAIAQIWVNYAREISNNHLAASVMNIVLPGSGIVWEGIMDTKALTMASLNTGIIVAQSIAQVASGKKGKKAGGYTDRAASDDKIVDFVHANEFVGTANAVRNPTVKPVFDIIKLAEEQGTIATLNLPAVMASGGLQSGGYTSSTTSTPAQAYTPTGNAASAIDSATAQKFTDAVERLMTWDPAISIEMLERKQNQYTKVTKGGLKG